MKLSLKITLALFLMTALFIAVLSVYFTTQMNKNFREQADRLLKQSVTLTEQRIELMKEQLRAEMDSLARSVFTENENILAGLLSDPPDYNAEVVQFAEKLRRRSTLDFLYIASSGGSILSNSAEPAAFGKPDPSENLPSDQILYLKDPEAAMELKKQLQFGRHVLLLRGGYFLKNRLKPVSISGLQLNYTEEPFRDLTSDPALLKETIYLKDLDEKPVAAWIVSTSQERLMEEKQQLLKKTIYLLLGALAGCLLIGWIVSLTISRPLRRLTAAAQEMTTGNFDVRVQENANGEMGKLIHAFNSMTEQIEENRKKLIQTERIAAWQEIARHLAHEIKNPLTPIRTSITNLRLAMERAPDQFPEIFRESSESIIEEVETLRHLADEFARFARLPAPNLQLNSLNDTVQKTIALYKNSADSNIRILWNPGEDVPSFNFDAEQIGQVIQNLLQNSIEAFTDGGEISVSSKQSQQKDKNWISLVIQDSGPGMSEQIKQEVFTPYFTTKQKGTGLGLAIVHRIVTEHGGNILVESEPGKGTRFEVRLPLL